MPAVMAMLIPCGCTPIPNFPVEPMTSDAAGPERLAFDVNGDGRADYWQRCNAQGRKRLLEFDDDADGKPDTQVDLDAIPGSECPHFVIVLDGVPYKLIHELYEQGRFRLFRPPSRLISCFPSMTDLALARAFHAEQPLACEALFLDPERNRLSNGNAVYLSMRNAMWAKKLDYRCSVWLDANAYLSPSYVFARELEGMLKTFRTVEKDQVIAYTVATAGLGTRGGAEAIRKYLVTVDRLCEQLVYERRGRVKLSLFADHGHNMTRCRRVSLKSYLAKAGFHVTNSLRKPEDVVVIEYGLVTYAALYTKDPAGVSQALLEHPAVELACYPQGDKIVVRDAKGEATIEHKDGRYRYRLVRGDPLELRGIIEQLGDRGKVTADGFVDDRALFEATVTHIYPDPLARIWLAFHGLVRWPPDLLVSLRDGYVNGSKMFNFFIGGVTSTHGSLNRVNSTTFAMSMLGELPPAMRLEEVFPALERARSGGAVPTTQAVAAAR